MPASWKRPQSACRGLHHLAGVQRILCAWWGNFLPLLHPVNCFSHLPVRSLNFFFKKQYKKCSAPRAAKSPQERRFILVNIRKPAALVRRGRGASPPRGRPETVLLVGTPDRDSADAIFILLLPAKAVWPWAGHSPSLRFSVFINQELWTRSFPSLTAYNSVSLIEKLTLISALFFADCDHLLAGCPGSSLWHAGISGSGTQAWLRCVGSRSPTRDPSSAPAVGGGVSVTGPAGTSPNTELTDSLSRLCPATLQHQTLDTRAE